MRFLPAHVALIAVLLIPGETPARAKPRTMAFVATAYAMKGATKSGLHSQPGTVAADTSVLPLGTTIRVTDAGPHSGVYTVTDSGGRVKGRHIDIYFPSWAKAKHFGRKVVQVTVLKWGDWEGKEE